MCVYNTHCTKYILFSIKISISGHYILEMMCNLVHSGAPAFIYNFKYCFLSGYWPCTVWSFLDRNLPQKVSQISSPLFQQIPIYHPMLRSFTQFIFTWRPSFILCEFFEIFLKPCSPAETDLLDLTVLLYLLGWAITKYSRF